MAHQGPKPISDRRLDEIRTECGAFRHIMACDVRCLIVRLDEAEGERHNVRARLEAREREMAALELEHQTLLRRLDALQRATGGASSPGDGP